MSHGIPCWSTTGTFERVGAGRFFWLLLVWGDFTITHGFEEELDAGRTVVDGKRTSGRRLTGRTISWWFVMKGRAVVDEGVRYISDNDESPGDFRMSQGISGLSLGTGATGRLLLAGNMLVGGRRLIGALVIGFLVVGKGRRRIIGKLKGELWSETGRRTSGTGDSGL